MDKIIETVKAHPILFISLAAFVAVYFLFSGSGSSNSDSADAATEAAAVAASAQASSQYAQTQAQLQAVQVQTGAQVQIAGIAAQVQDAQNAAEVTALQSQDTLDAQQNQMAVLNNIVGNAFETATAGITSNYNTQLAYASDLPGASSNPWETTTSVGGNPASVQNINTANTQIEEMFNNLILAVQGQGPIDNAIVTDGTPPTNSNNQYVYSPVTSGVSVDSNGGSKSDPMFISFSPTQLPTITDVSPDANNAAGWSGSIFNPNTNFFASAGNLGVPTT